MTLVNLTKKKHVFVCLFVCLFVSVCFCLCLCFCLCFCLFCLFLFCTNSAPRVKINCYCPCYAVPCKEIKITATSPTNTPLHINSKCKKCPPGLSLRAVTPVTAELSGCYGCCKSPLYILSVYLQIVTGVHTQVYS